VADDIVDRLRSKAESFRNAEGLALLDILDEVTPEDLEEAADEIERLRRNRFKIKPDPQRNARRSI